MNLIYMAKPIYGGWISFTVHLSLINNSNIYKIGKRSEKKKRNFGFDLEYQNLTIDDIIKLDDIMIVALDKHYYQYLKYFKPRTKLVIHDPTEIKNKDNPLIKDELLKTFDIITIRKTVQQFIKETYNIDSSFIYHPFYKYDRPIQEYIDNFAISISRIDFDKNIDIILKANKLLSENKCIKIYGKENRLYVHHKLKILDFETYWEGKYSKDLQINKDGKDLLKNTKYVIDLSTIKNDGGGTQYTFLDAIYNDCILILHENWINRGDLFINGYNCISVKNEQDLSNVLSNELTDEDLNKIIVNSKKILDLCHLFFI